MALFSILVLGLFLRILNINESFWLDEATSGLVVRNFDLSGILYQFLPGDFHPPLYYFTLKGWSEIFGFREIALRSMSLVFGLLTIWFVYKTVFTLFGKATGLLASMFLAINPIHVYYSTEARMYSMLTFFVVLSFFFFTKLTQEKKQSIVLWAGYSLSLLFIVMTDYVGVFVMPVYLLVATMFKKDKQFWTKLILAYLPLFIVFILYKDIFWQQLQSGLGVKTAASGWWQILGQPSLKNIILIPTKFMLGRINYDSRAVYAFWIFVSALLWLIPIYFALKKEKRTKIFLLWGTLPILFSLMVGFFIPVVVYFRLLFVLPGILILVAIGSEKLSQNLFLPFLVLFLLINIMFNYRYFTNPRFHREDWRSFAKFVSDDSELVYVANSQKEGIVYYKPEQEISYYPEIKFTKEKILLMRYVADIYDPKDKARQMVEDRGFIKIAEHDFNGIVVWEYEK